MDRKNSMFNTALFAQIQFTITHAITVEPWIASRIRSRNVLVIQNTRTSK